MRGSNHCARRWESARPRRAISPPSLPSNATVEKFALAAFFESMTMLREAPLWRLPMAMSSGHAWAMSLPCENHFGTHVIGQSGDVGWLHGKGDGGMARRPSGGINAVHCPIVGVSGRAGVSKMMSLLLLRDAHG